MNKLVLRLPTFFLILTLISLFEFVFLSCKVVCLLSYLFWKFLLSSVIEFFCYWMLTSAWHSNIRYRFWGMLGYALLLLTNLLLSRLIATLWSRLISITVHDNITKSFLEKLVIVHILFCFVNYFLVKSFWVPCLLNGWLLDLTFRLINFLINGLLYDLISIELGC